MNTSKRNIIKHPIHRSVRVDSASFNTEGRQDLSVSDRDRLQWWSKARFGMFIHWGIYSVPAGRWKDKKIAGIAEWLMHKATVPVLEYERLASCFNPVQYGGTPACHEDIKDIAKNQPNFKEAPDSKAKEGDLVILDYTATVDDKPFKLAK